MISVWYAAVEYNAVFRLEWTLKDDLIWCLLILNSMWTHVYGKMTLQPQEYISKSSFQKHWAKSLNTAIAACQRQESQECVTVRSWSCEMIYGGKSWQRDYPLCNHICTITRMHQSKAACATSWPSRLNCSSLGVRSHLKRIASFFFYKICVCY